MDRASDSGSEGWGFESLPVCQDKIEDTHQGYPLFYFAIPEKKGLVCKKKKAGDFDRITGLTFLLKIQPWGRRIP